MNNLETLKKEVKEMENKKPETLQSMIEKSTRALGKALPSHLSPERLVRSALTCIRLNPELANCTPASFLGGLFVLAQLGLEPIAGRAYLLPFNNSKKINGKWITTKEVQVVIGYKGLVDLFYRHQASLSIDMQTIYETDDFSFEYGTNSYIKHKPNLDIRTKVIGYYAIAKMHGGGSTFKVMGKKEVEDYAKKHSKSYITQEWSDIEKKKVKIKEPYFKDGCPWLEDFDAMAMKTVLIQLAKLLPLSVELQRAIQIDETSRDFKEGIDDALDIQPTTNWEGEDNNVKL